MDLLSLFKNRKIDEVWVTAAMAQENFDGSLWELFFLKMEDDLGGQLDILDKNDPPRRPVLGQNPAELAKYLARVLTAPSYTVVHGVRNHDSFTMSIDQSIEDGIIHTRFLLARPYDGDIDDVIDWANASLTCLIRIFSPYVAEVELRSDSARVKSSGNYWIGRQVPRLAYKQYFGRSYTSLFKENFSSLPIHYVPFHSGTMLTLSERIDKIDQNLVDKLQMILAGGRSLNWLPDKVLIE